MGVRPHQVLFVGHKAAELEGARALGIKTVAFNRDTDAEGDIQIDRFAQLLGLLTGQSRIPGIEE
jgi:FMN phosphatase YigB (HAD superfamily)